MPTKKKPKADKEVPLEYQIRWELAGPFLLRGWKLKDYFSEKKKGKTEYYALLTK